MYKEMRASFFLSLLLLSLSLLLQGGGCSRQTMHGDVSQSQTVASASTNLFQSRLDLIGSMRKLLARPKHEKDEEKMTFAVLDEEEEDAETSPEMSLLLFCFIMAGFLLVALPIVYWRKRALSK